MKYYGDLKLTQICDNCDLHFANYTYLRRQCSCCYGPLDMPAKYWRGGKKPVEFIGGEGRLHYELDGKTISEKDIHYILFKNSYNGSGCKKKTDIIEGCVYISHNFADENQKLKVCQMLIDQLDSDYILLVPYKDDHCIRIVETTYYNETKDHSQYDGYCPVPFGSNVEILFNK